MVTVEEFNRSIEQLYQNDFVLVNLNDLIQKRRTRESFL